jgi:MraZ protein
MNHFVLGEFRRSIDDRFRLSIPAELVAALPEGENAKCILAKERPGAVSLWRPEDWGDRLDKDVAIIQSKMEAGHLKDRTTDVQLLGRLLSTRHREIPIAGRGRISIPEGFREFLGIEAGGEAIVIGAALCVEVWNPTSWVDYLEEQIPQFGKLVEELAR